MCLHTEKAMNTGNLWGIFSQWSFVLKPDTTLFNRRTSKIVSTFASLFSSNYVFYWNEFFPNNKLLYPPCFDGRCVLYPNVQILRDYLSWRQVDCWWITFLLLTTKGHINNLYNTCFWTLVLQGGKTPTEAEAALRVGVLLPINVQREHYQNRKMNCFSVLLESITTTFHKYSEKVRLFAKWTSKNKWRIQELTNS